MLTHYLFIGLAPAERDTRLARLKENLFPGKTPQPGGGEPLDLEVLDGHKLSADRLKAELMALPAVAVKRLVIVRRAEKLTKECMATAEEFLKGNYNHAALVLDAASWDGRTTEGKSIRKLVQVISAPSEKEVNVFDMMEAVFAGSAADGLQILKKLSDNGEDGTRLLGGIIWFWCNRAKSRVREGRYKKGLLVLQEADERLKRSKLPDREYAVENALVKLSLLLKV